MLLLFFRDEFGASPVGDWMATLSDEALLRVKRALARMRQGNLSNAKSVGDGLHEYRVDWGPGYRIYFGRDGADVLIVLGGGSKARQQADIDAAKLRWRQYKLQKGGA